MTIRATSFALDTDTFAAQRRQTLASADAELEPVIRKALPRVGMARWEESIVEAALRIFDRAAADEQEEPTPGFDEMRQEFERELTASLRKTKAASSEQREAQVQRTAKWLSTYAINAGTEAAVVGDEANVGLEWVTMGDGDVRDSHVEANGQTVPSGQPFTVAGQELLFPGQPVGDPAVWMNCRCMARPAVLEDGFKAKGEAFAAEVAEGEKMSVTVLDKLTPEFRARLLEQYGPLFAEEGKLTVTAAGEPDAGEQVKAEEYTSTVIVALPAADDPISAASSETSGAHTTLLFLGDSAALDEAALVAAVEKFVAEGKVGIITEQVNGRATLGKDAADVVLYDAANLVFIREGLLADEVLAGAHASVEQFPTWLPHVTLGYPAAPAVGEYTNEAITFDRLAVWHGESRTEFPLGAAVEVVEGGQQQSDPVESEFSTVSRLTPPEEEVVEDTNRQSPDTSEDPEEPHLGEEPPELDEADLYMPVPWHALLAPTGVPSGDKRMFALNQLTEADMPLTLKRQVTDAPGHDGSFPIGRIDKVWTDENGAKWGEGVFDSNEQGYEAIRVIAEQIQVGISVDVDSVEGETNEQGVDEYTKARTRAATMCSIPAFAEARIWLGPAQDIKEEDVETEEMPSTVSRLTVGGHSFDIAPRKTKDGPGWITAPKPTQKITGYWVDGPGAPKIGWGAPGDFNRCRLQLGKYVQNPEWLAGLCANLHYRALGVWPGQATGKVTTMSTVIASAAATRLLPADHFRNPNLTEPTRLTIEGDHVYGHLATWESCHIGYAEECKAPPESVTDYSYFLTGEVDTDAGPVAVGQITMGAGHADPKLGLVAAASHYDRLCSSVADITVGEDSVGIWYSGHFRPEATADQRFSLRASGSLSGDWRGVRVKREVALEMIAALAVNVPGFPIPTTTAAMAGKRQLSLTAAGVIVPDRETRAELARTTVRQHRAELAKRRLSIEGR